MPAAVPMKVLALKIERNDQSRESHPSRQMLIVASNEQQDKMKPAPLTTISMNVRDSLEDP
jgi:hypothetical protein